MTAKVLRILGILILCGVAYKLMYTLSSRGDIVKIVVPMVFGIIVLIISMSWQYGLKEKNPSYYALLHRPYLEPVISISINEESKFTSEFAVSNLGKLPARNIISVTKSPWFSSDEIEPPLPRELVSGARMVISPKSGPITFPIDTNSSIDLILLYEADIDGNTHQYQSTYRYEFSAGPIDTGNYGYVSSRHTEGTLSAREPIDLASARIMNELEGTVYFEGNDSEQNRIYNSIFLKSKKKTIMYNPGVKKLSLYHIIDQGRAYLINVQVKNPCDLDKVAITFRNERISLTFDGEVKNQAI